MHVILPIACDVGRTSKAMHALILIWRGANVQEKLDGMSRNRMIYERIAYGIREAGHDYSWK